MNDRAGAALPVGAAHAAALASIHAESFPPGQQWNAAAVAGILAMPGVIALLDPAGAMALARVAADEAELLTLAVAPARRRQGRGAALLREVARRAASQGARRLILEVAAGNAPARALYEGAGFGPVGLRRGYYSGGGDALVLAASLPLCAAAAPPGG